MPYQLSVVRKGGHLHASVRGSNTPETVLKYLAEVRETCLRERCGKVLIEEYLEGPGIDTLQIFEVVTEAGKNVVPGILRVAYVDTNPAHDAGKMKFAETVAVNRGVNVKVFADLREAAAWLEAEPEGEP
jgi:hypothetical protein